MIKPTIGRVVWVHRAESLDPSQAEAALVTYVHGDTCINVAGFDANGQHFAATSVYLNQDGEELPEWTRGPNHGTWAEWMPYQKAQAAKDSAQDVAGR